MCILKGPFVSDSQVYIKAANLTTQTSISNDTFIGTTTRKWNRNLHIRGVKHQHFKTSKSLSHITKLFRSEFTPHSFRSAVQRLTDTGSTRFKVKEIQLHSGQFRCPSSVFTKQWLVYVPPFVGTETTLALADTGFLTGALGSGCEVDHPTPPSPEVTN